MSTNRGRSLLRGFLTLALTVVFAAGCDSNFSTSAEKSIVPATAANGAIVNSATVAQASPTTVAAAETATAEPNVAISGSAAGSAATSATATADSAVNGATTAATTAPSPPEAAAAGASFVTAIRNVAQITKPAVVQITNLQQVQSQQFGQPFTVPAGVGSGFIYDDQGHILTNNHVVEGASQLQVSLPDGQSYPAKVIGTDPQTDLAVVQVQGKNLPIAKIGKSSDMQVGDWVVAIGNALGLPGGPTVSQGVVSAVGRTVQEPGTDTGNGQTSAAGPYLFDVIQTDAPINPGNSGGPLVNLAGEVIGIDTLVAGQAEPGVQAQGIGFAIAIDTAKPIADQLVASGKVTHPYMGILYQPLNPAIVAQLNLQVKNGVLVQDVEQGSPADQAGLQQRDVITAADGKQLVGESDLAYAVNQHKVGEKITLTVVRGTDKKDVELTLVARPTQ